MWVSTGGGKHQTYCNSKWFWFITSLPLLKYGWNETVGFTLESKNRKCNGLLPSKAFPPIVCRGVETLDPCCFWWSWLFCDGLCDNYFFVSYLITFVCSTDVPITTTGLPSALVKPTFCNTCTDKGVLGQTANVYCVLCDAMFFINLREVRFMYCSLIAGVCLFSNQRVRDFKGCVPKDNDSKMKYHLEITDSAEFKSGLIFFKPSLLLYFCYFCQHCETTSSNWVRLAAKYTTASLGAFLRGCCKKPILDLPRWPYAYSSAFHIVEANG